MRAMKPDRSGTGSAGAEIYWVFLKPTHKLRALQTGAKNFISKPFDLAEVLMRVHNMLEVRLLVRPSHPRPTFGKIAC
ncbi:hypothetical protein GCM10027419_48950 [Pandoraea terrae]